MGLEERTDSEVREDSEVTKFGMALVFSLGGIAFSILRNRRINPSIPSAGGGREADPKEDDLKLRMDDNNKQQEHYDGDDESCSSNDAPCFVPEAEMELLEYLGLKEQEAIIKELQGRIRVQNMEAEVNQQKIGSLEEENRGLKARVGGYAKVVTELDAENGVLRRQIGDLKNELEDMKKANEKLEMENSEMALKLEKLQILATSALENGEVEELQHQNLRWVNACLRRELRNHQPGTSNATNGGSRKNTMNIHDLDCVQWASDEVPSEELSLEIELVKYAQALKMSRGKPAF